MSAFRNIAQSVADAVQEAFDASGEASRVTVLVEDKLDADFEVKNALSETGILVLVGVVGFDRKSSSGAWLYGTVRFDVTVCEAPAVSRLDADFLTAQGVAERVMETLHWKKTDGLDTPIRYQSANRADDAERIVVQMSFVAEALVGEETEVSE